MDPLTGTEIVALTPQQFEVHNCTNCGGKDSTSLNTYTCKMCGGSGWIVIDAINATYRPVRRENER